MNTLPLIHTSFVSPFVDYLSDKGCHTRRYIQQAKLPEKTLESAVGHVSERHFYHMLHLAARKEGIDQFGLEVAQTVPVSSLGELAEQMAAMPTLYASLDLFCRRWIFLHR